MVFCILALSLIGFSSVLCEEFECSKDPKTFDTFVTDYFLLAAPTRKFPTNQGEVKKFCKYAKIARLKINSSQWFIE